MRDIVPDNDERGGRRPPPLRRVRIMHAFSLVHAASDLRRQ